MHRLFNDVLIVVTFLPWFIINTSNILDDAAIVGGGMGRGSVFVAVRLFAILIYYYNKF